MAYEIDPGYLEKYKDSAWMETYTGRQFYPANPRIQDFTIFDIAHALANKCRYNGHSAKFYSVAEHCVKLALMARHLKHDVKTQFWFLMHDASEAYLPDVPRPIKHFFPDLIKMEHHCDALIREWCGLGHDMPPLIKEWDSRIIVDERRQLLLPSGNKWQVDDLQPLGLELHGHDPFDAQFRFLQAYQVIGAEFQGKPNFMCYDPGEFASRIGYGVNEDVNSDVPGKKILDVRMVDLRGNCAMYSNENGFIRFQHGNYELILPS
jgi:hypothetical protein